VEVLSSESFGILGIDHYVSEAELNNFFSSQDSWREEKDGVLTTEMPLCRNALINYYRMLASSTLVFWLKMMVKWKESDGSACRYMRS